MPDLPRNWKRLAWQWLNYQKPKQFMLRKPTHGQRLLKKGMMEKKATQVIVVWVRLVIKEEIQELLGVARFL